MALTTLLQLRTRARQEADQVNSLFCTDAEVNQYVVTAYQDLYGQIVQHFGDDYFTQSPTTGYTFTTDGINQFFALPTSGSEQLCFKLLGVDVQVSAGISQWIALRPFAFADRNRAAFPNTQIPQAGQTVRLLYVPYPTLPSVDASTIDGCNGWEEFVVLDAAMKMMAKEESDTSVLMARRAKLEERLNSEIENRNATEHGGKIVDTRTRGYVGMQYRLNGNNLWLVGGPTPMSGYGYSLMDDDYGMGWW
jgi:hypothetical protein